MVAVADPDAAALSQVSGGAARIETDWHVLIDADDIEVIHIVTPPFLRQPIVKAAFAAGKSVFCEKPPALSLLELDEMLRAAANHNQVFGADFVMRHLPAYRFLIAATRWGSLGAPRTVTFTNLAQRVPPGHWFWDANRSGGIFVEHGIHFFDAYRQILGSPLSVQAVVPRTEAAVATVEYTAGTFATYFHEFAYPAEVERTESTLGFDGATMTLEGWIPTRLSGVATSHLDDLRDLAHANEVPLKLPPDLPGSFEAVFPDRQRLYGRAIAAGMRDVVRKHRDPARVLTPTTADIRDSLELALAAQQSALTGTKVLLERFSETIEESSTASRLK